MPKPSAVCPPVIITEPSTPRLPGDCDVAGCTHAASYAVGNYYLCAGCLIESCEANKIPIGTVIYRVSQKVHVY